MLSHQIHSPSPSIILAGDGHDGGKLKQEFMVIGEGSFQRPPTTGAHPAERKSAPHSHNNYGCHIVEETRYMGKEGNKVNCTRAQQASFEPKGKCPS